MSSWKDFYIIYNNITFYNKYSILSFYREEPTTFGNAQSFNIKSIFSSWDLKTILFRNLHKILPIFSFYIYKVDKQIFKNTRGKSGKYTFIWKYVTQYKRTFLLMF